MTEAISAPSSYTSPNSGQMRVRGADFTAAELIWVVHRDPSLAISDGDYVVTMRVNGENRPVYIEC